jgi:hypothetical protein
VKIRCLALIILTSTLCLAEEGMWTYNNLPTAKLKQAYGFEPTRDWLDNVRLSSVRLAQGCSGSFVSPSGLVMTNHHCAASCIQELSTKDKDYFSEGFTAPALTDEKRCPELEINQLVSITTVTKRVTDALTNKSGQEYTKALNGIKATIEKECSKGDDNTRCEVVSLYNGGVYDLYQYRRYQDVRLAFAPEFRIAFFGGDPDNFQFPRYNLDLSFLRVYDNGKPLATPNHLKWSKAGSKEGDLTFVAGNPGSTERLKTIAELEEIRDHDLPNRLYSLYELRGMLWQFQQRGEEQKRISTDDLFGVENTIKALKGEWDALQNDAFFASKVAAEKDIRAKVSAKPDWKKQYGNVWRDIEQAIAKSRQIQTYSLPVTRVISRSQLLQIAFTLTRASQELPKPNAERLPGYSDARLPALKQRLFTEAPIYKELEIEKLAHGLEKLRESLGPDSDIVKKLIGKQSPRDLATSLINQTTLDNPETRKKLFEGGAAAIQASNDPMLEFARKLEPIEREFTLQSQREVQPVLTRGGEALSKIRFALYGTSVYPDATFTPRLSYGSVKGWMENGRKIGPYTIIGGAFERQTGADPFRLPDSWLEAKSRLDLTTPFNLVTTNDIIGGNSGSPVFNRNAEIVGLIFDGNIHSLGGAFGFDETMNRSVAVDSRAMEEALSKVYKAERLLNELRGRR